MSLCYSSTYCSALKEQLHQHEVNKEQLRNRLATVPREPPIIHLIVSGIHCRKVARPAEAFVNRKNMT